MCLHTCRRHIIGRVTSMLMFFIFSCCFSRFDKHTISKIHSGRPVSAQYTLLPVLRSNIGQLIIPYSLTKMSVCRFERWSKINQLQVSHLLHQLKESKGKLRMSLSFLISNRLNSGRICFLQSPCEKHAVGLWITFIDMLLEPICN